jgi:hypothetical protein
MSYKNLSDTQLLQRGQDKAFQVGFTLLESETNQLAEIKTGLSALRVGAVFLRLKTVHKSTTKLPGVDADSLAITSTIKSPKKRSSLKEPK